MLFNNTSLAIFVVSVQLFIATSAAASSLFEGGASYTYNDNTNNGQRPEDIKPDHSVRLNLSAGKYYQLTDFSGISLTADFSAEKYNTYSLLDNFSVGGTASLRTKFGYGHSAPIGRVSTHLSYINSQDKQRDRWLFSSTVGISKLFFDRLDISLEYNFSETKADHVVDHPFLSNIPPFLGVDSMGGDVHDLRAQQYSISAIFVATESLSLYSKYSMRDGDIVASTAPYLEILRISDAGAVDKAFDNIAYTFDADSDIYTVGLSWTLNGHSSINIDYTRRESEAAGGFMYFNDIYQASLLYAF
jgi:hypothetical protein